MLETELLKLNTTIPEFQEMEETKDKIYETYQSTIIHKRFHFRIKPAWIISMTIIILVFIGILSMNKNTIVGQFSYFKKEANLSIIDEFKKHSIVDQVYTVGKQKQCTIDDLFSYGLLNQQQLEVVKNYESNSKLNDNKLISQKLQFDLSHFTYHFYMGQKDGIDMIVLIDNHSDEEYMIYASFDLDLDYKQEEMIAIYKKHNMDEIVDKDALLQLDCTISNHQAKHTYSISENCNSVNYVLSTDRYKVMSIYSDVSISQLTQIHKYYEGYNKNSLNYISDLKFEGKEVGDPFACMPYYIKPLKERIAGIVNENQTMYEIEYSINDSPLLGAYVSEETYRLIETARKYTILQYGGKYNNNLALYYSLLEKGYILDSLTWIEFEYNAIIPSELDGMYLIEFCQYQTITIIQDIIHQQDINYSFTIMIRPIFYNGSSYSGYFVDIEKANSKLIALKYAPRYGIEFFNSRNDEIILRDITDNTKGARIGEYIEIYNNNKVIRYYDEIFLSFRRDDYDEVYDGFLDQLNNILLTKEIVYNAPSYIDYLDIEKGMVIKKENPYRYIVGYNYYFDYELWMDFIRKAVESYES